MFLSKYGVARHIYIPLVKRGVVDFAVGADFTPAAGDVKISKDGGAAANVTNLPTAIAMGNGAIWDFSLTATEMQAAQVIVTVADSATKAVEDQSFIIETHGNASAQFAIDLTINQTGDSYARLGAPAGASTAADVAAVKAVLPSALVSGRIDASVGAMAANVLTATAIATDAITAGKIAADAIGASELAADAATEIGTAVWATAARTLTANTNLNDLSAAGVRAAVGLASANLDTQLDALPTNAELATALGTADDAVLAQVALVKAKTDNLPSDPADASDIAASFSTVNGTLATIAGYVDTEIGTLQTTATAIKAKTDSLTFTKAGEVDTNVKSVADGTVTGTGSEADPWGP